MRGSYHWKTPRTRRQSSYLLVLAIGLASMASVAWAASSANLFSEANAKYQQGDFRAAADLYRKHLQAGHVSGAVYYNLGNATLRLGQKGEALIFYERALKISPRDKDLRWNIQVLKSALPDRIEDKVANPFYTPVDLVLKNISLDEIALGFSLGLVLMAVLSLLEWLVFSFRSAAGFLRTGVLLYILVSGAWFAVKWWDQKDPRAVVLDKETTAYYGPSDRESKAFTLHEGAQGKILDESGDWVYLALKNKNTGWIRKNSCEIV